MIIFKMKALLATCKPLILLDFHRSFNDTPTKKPPFSYENGGFSCFLLRKLRPKKFAFPSDHRNITDGFLV